MISLVMPGLSAGNDQPIKLLILGDSLTAGYGVQTSDAFPAVLENRLQKKGYAVKVMAAGKDGATSASGLSRLKWHLRRNPDLLLLELGGNDGLRSIDPAVTRKNLANIIEHAQSEGLPVILTGMKMPLNYPKAYRSRFEAVFPELASKYDTPFIPFLLKGVGGQPEYNLPDQIHPNEAGHQKVAEHLLPQVEKVLHKHFSTPENTTSEKP